MIIHTDHIVIIDAQNKDRDYGFRYNYNKELVI